VEADQRVVVDLAAGADRDVVQENRQPTGGACNGLEMGSEAGLTRTAVVRRHGEDACDTGVDRGTSQVDGMVRVVRCRPGEYRDRHRLGNRPPQVPLLDVRQGW
jgi:hypothetical protein